MGPVAKSTGRYSKLFPLSLIKEDRSSVVDGGLFVEGTKFDTMSPTLR